jgi:membrane protease YdiL (CAAX protease family)
MENKLMIVDLKLYYEDLHFLIPVVGTLVSFSIFWFTWQSDGLKKRLVDQFGKDEGSARLVIYTKILGGLTMAFLPAIIYLSAFPETKLSEFGWELSKETFFSTMLWGIGLSIVMFFVIAFNAKKESNLRYYPQIRAKRWTKSMLLWNLAGWTIYLVGYEALFRGVLLFPLVKHMGLWGAISVNIGLYAGTHIPKGLKETVASIPLCIVLCLLTIQVGNIWIAAVVHVVMAWTSELVSLKYNPDMVLVKN